MNTTDFNWIPFCEELANKLLPYRKDRKSLISKIREVYSHIGMKIPTLDSDGQIIDIDPFTVFGLFNKRITSAKRIAIIREVAQMFDVALPIPETFDGIPMLNNLNATFYRFAEERGPEDIDRLWDLFEKALLYADIETSGNREVFLQAYNLVKDLKGNRFKLTLGLFWIRPNKYINLDSRNRWFISIPENMPTSCGDMVRNLLEIPDAETYLQICDNVRHAMEVGSYDYRYLPELSETSWRISEQVNLENKKASLLVDQESEADALPDQNIGTTHYWLYAPGASAVMWEKFYEAGIMAIGWFEIGDLSAFSSKSEMQKKLTELCDPSTSNKNTAHATWQFSREMKRGDIVFVKRGSHQIIGRGIVESDYYYDESRHDTYPNTRKVRWTHNGDWEHPGKAVVKTLTDITPYSEYVEKLNALFNDDPVPPIETDPPITLYPLYSMDEFLDEVYMDETEYRDLVALLEKKKNVILQGAPGVGKTFAAKRLAYSIMGVKDPDRVMMIQFHQSYSYEDFIMGFRPSDNGFEIKRGAFYNFCKKAEIDSDNKFFFIIDEINRGNLSKIFGELLMLIEKDKRGIELQLLYANEKFSVPKNVYIIGMMNTADRSLALMDYALRRRFAFFEMRPGFRSDGFRTYRENFGDARFDKLIQCVENLNEAIRLDSSLGEGFRIGHSFFCGINEITDQTLTSIVSYELIPLLKEYWFDEPQKVQNWTDMLRSAIK